MEPITSTVTTVIGVVAKIGSSLVDSKVKKTVESFNFNEFMPQLITPFDEVMNKRIGRADNRHFREAEIDRMNRDMELINSGQYLEIKNYLLYLGIGLTVGVASAYGYRKFIKRK